MWKNLVLVVLASVSTICAPGRALAQIESQPSQGQWAIGWDNGLGVRRRLSPHWDLGFRLSGDYARHDRAEDSRYPDTTITEVYKTAGGSIGTAVYVFYSKHINDWIRFGPYLGASFVHRSDHSRTGPHYDSNQNDFGIEIGARPTFTLWKRFVFESRIGVSYTHFHEVEERRYSDGNISTRDSGWAMRSFGQNLGLNALMQFMIYF